MNREHLFQTVILVGVFAIIALIGVYVGVLDLVPQVRAKILESDQEFLQAAGNASVFYSFIIGVPVSVVVALVAAFIGARITERQGDVETLRFIEEKVKGSLGVFVRILSSLRITLRTGNVLLAVVREKLGAEAASAEEARRKFDIDNVTREVAGEFGNINETLCAELSELKSAIEETKKDLYAPLILRRSLEQSNRDVTALSFIREHLPEGHGVPDVWLTPDVFEIAPLLLRWAEHTKPYEAVLAYLLMPNTTFKTSHFVGLMLMRQYFDPEKGPARLGALEVTRVYYNLGGAWIMQAYRALPRRDDVGHLFREILQGRSPIALRLLNAIGPDVTNFESRDWLSAMDATLKSMDNYIILRTKDGQTHSYDPKKHGSLKPLNLRRPD